MKINPVKSIIILLINALIAYGMYNLHKGDNRLLLGFGSFFLLAIPAMFSMGVRLKNERASANVRILSGLFYPVILILSIVFTFIPFSYIPYVIINGILLLIFLYLVYSIGRARQ